MTSLVLMHDESHAKVWRAVGLSIALHLLVVAIYPTLSHITLPELPDKLEIEFFTVKAPPPASVQQQPVQQTPTAEPQKVTPVTKAPLTKNIAPTTKPVLAAPANSEADYHVPEQVQARPEPAKPEPAAPAAPATAAAASTSESASNAASEAKDSRAAASTSVQVASESDALTAGDQDAWGDYGEQLRALVNKSKQYPTIAIRRHLEGDVMIVAHFIRGELANVSLADSSKHVPLDDEALRMVKKAIGQLGVKESLKKKTFNITIPVSFRLE